MIRLSSLVLAGALLLPAQDAGLRQQSGKYEVSLRLPPGGLFAQEEMQIEFRVADGSTPDPVTGPAPVVRARIRSQIDMPEMPGMPQLREEAHPEGVAGDYGLHPTFVHGGRFRLSLFVEPPGAPEFRVEFGLNVGDAGTGKRKAAVKPFKLDLATAPKQVKAGAPVDLRMRVLRAAVLPQSSEKVGSAVTQFDRVHEKFLHLILVRADLGWFAHLHPDDSPSGEFTLRTEFPFGGEYLVFADTAPRGAGSQVLAGRIKVSGKSGAPFAIGTASRETVSVSEGLRVTVNMPESGAVSGKTMRIPFAVADAASGQPVANLEPLLGAAGHLIAIHQDGVTYVHAHPDERGASPEPGVVPFLVRFPKPGLYRAWAQFQRGGAVRTFEFVFEAKP